MEADLVTRAGIPFTTVPAAGLHGVGTRIFGNLVKMLRGYLAARQLIAEFRPQVLFFTGGYVAAPVGLAGRTIPTLVCLPDIEPGLAIRLLTRFADHITVPAEESLAFFPAGKAFTVAGYPTRAELAHWDKDQAGTELQLQPDLPTLLVMGGSLGARSINRALFNILPDLLPRVQVIHLTGQITWPEVEAVVAALPGQLRTSYHPFPYLHERIGAAFAAADLVVSRAGASILGELPLFALPAILVPYPHAWRYQKVNAEYLASRGAAVVLPDQDLAHRLSSQIQDILFDQHRIKQMSTAMASLAKPEAARHIASLLRHMSTQAGGTH